MLDGVLDRAERVSFLEYDSISLVVKAFAIEEGRELGCRLESRMHRVLHDGFLISIHVAEFDLA